MKTSPFMVPWQVHSETRYIPWPEERLSICLASRARALICGRLPHNAMIHQEIMVLPSWTLHSIGRPGISMRGEMSLYEPVRHRRRVSNGLMNKLTKFCQVMRTVQKPWIHWLISETWRWIRHSRQRRGYAPMCNRLRIHIAFVWEMSRSAWHTREKTKRWTTASAIWFLPCSQKTFPGGYFIKRLEKGKKPCYTKHGRNQRMLRSFCGMTTN